MRMTHAHEPGTRTTHAPAHAHAGRARAIAFSALRKIGVYCLLSETTDAFNGSSGSRLAHLCPLPGQRAHLRRMSRTGRVADRTRRSPSPSPALLVLREPPPPPGHAAGSLPDPRRTGTRTARWLRERAAGRSPGRRAPEAPRPDH